MSHLVEIRDLQHPFTGSAIVHAVHDLSLWLGEGEVLGSGESGSGKSCPPCRALSGYCRKAARRNLGGASQVLWDIRAGAR